METDPNKFSGIACPNCAKTLHVENGCLKCEEGHSYDISSRGYVNLLLQHKKGTIPGDNKDMVRARRTFLNNGYYKPLADKLAQVMDDISASMVADIGCGEGYYTGRIASGGDRHVTGFDISKFALSYAANTYKDIAFCVATLHDLPLDDDAFDTILCCFCAYDEVEFSRVLNENGKFVLVTPGKRHLFGLKKVLYDNPYENNTDIQLKYFELVDTYEVSYDIAVPHDDIWNLFSMTPYYWKTSKEGANRLKALDELNTEVDFIIRVFQKKRHL